jgi:uncharacterized membrane protein YfcA
VEPLLLLMMAFVIGLAAGLLSGMFGIGGGIIMVPALIAAGLAAPTDNATSFNIATACSLFAIIFLSPTGSYVHMRANHLNVKYGLVLGVAGVVGGIIGSYFSKSLPQDWLEGGFAVFTVLMGIQMMLKDNKDKKIQAAREENGDCTPEHDRKESSECNVHNPYPYLVLLGIGAGILAGTMGVGGGLIIVPVMVMLGVGIHVAVGTSLMAIIFTASASVATKAAIIPSILPILTVVAIPLAIGGCLAAYFGARIAEKTRSRQLSRYFSVLLFFIGAYMLLRSLGYL